MRAGAGREGDTSQCLLSTSALFETVNWVFWVLKCISVTSLGGRETPLIPGEPQLCPLPLTSACMPGPPKSGVSGESWVLGGPVGSELGVFEACLRVAWGRWRDGLVSGRVPGDRPSTLPVASITQQACWPRNIARRRGTGYTEKNKDPCDGWLLSRLLAVAY